jgi:hypothetical protein
MKKTIAGACMCAFLSGCGIISSDISPEYAEYLRTREKVAAEYYKAVQTTPRAEISVPAPGGGTYTFKTFDKPEWVQVDQEAPNEWVPVARAAVGAAGMVGGIYAAGSVVENILQEAAGATYNTGGGNLSLTNVGNKNIAAGSGTHSIYGHENPTTHLILQPE